MSNVVTGRAALSSAISGEWAKARTWPVGRIIVILAIVGAILGSVAFEATVPLTMGKSLAQLTDRQRVEVSLLGVDVANIVCLVAAILFVSNENSSNLVQVTARLTPVRKRVVMAKLLVVLAISAVVSVVATVLAHAAGMITVALAGAPVPALTGRTVLTLLAVMLMIPVHAVLAVAIAYQTRSGLIAFLLVFLIMCLPSLVGVLPAAVDRAAQFVLITPALHTMSGIATPGEKDFTNPLAAVGVLLAWTAIPISIAIVAFRRRDI
ncbi:ABC transporter permease [Actinomyces sp. B33]|uniref:ABC transporter permease n=1 Tax=Actinomyces sp. B33 TaxID=2942131 RepID=UPI0023410504|nr:ABC transporter permease [Actinomyces sp. B33]MDC4233453.1 ABC transporter permease [Actinomyces sp. B33]